MVYLDHNATTKPTAGVVEAVTAAMVDGWGNPSSVHRFGQEAKHSVEVARGRVAKLLGVKGGGRGIVFTGTGSEAIGLGIRGTMMAMKGTGKNVIITSSVEHSAVRELCDQLGSGDEFEVRTIGVDGDGVIDFGALEAALGGGDVGVVSVQWVNNETGVVQDVGRIGELCREHGAVFHCDATQWVGKMETCVDGGVDGERPEEGALIDVLTCAPHKFHGVKGVGVLWARSDRARRVRLVPMVPGSQELGRRGGTEGVPAIVGAGVAAMEAMEWLSSGKDDRDRLSGMRDRLERTIVERCSAVMGEAVAVNGGKADHRSGRMWNVTNLGFPGLEAEALLLAMSERGLCASAGAACASGSLEASDVLVAMGVGERIGRGSVRLSLSRETTEDEIYRGIEIVCQAVEVVGRSMV